LMRGIQQCFIDIQNRCVRATDELSRLVIETASHRPATLKDFRTQELALERQTQLWELSKFEPIGTRQEEIAKKLCRFQIGEEGSRLNIATQNAIGFALSRFLDPTPGKDVPTINLKKVFSTCREKFCSINGAPVGRVLDEGMRQDYSNLLELMLRHFIQTHQTCGMESVFLLSHSFGVQRMAPDANLSVSSYQPGKICMHR
jgi:hypothetical protein